MKDKANAKINLALDVYNIRDNGYHDIKSVMVPLDFCDELEIKISDNDSYESNFDFSYDENNSIYKMIHQIKEKYHIKDKHTVILNKKIPTQAGLAGGTSDAAAALRIMEKLYNLSLSKEEIKQLCLNVGADVLFNYYNFPSIVSGIGDEVEPINIKDDYYVLLIKPETGVSTKQAYELLDMNICDHPDIDSLVHNLEEGLAIKSFLQNSLEQPALLLNKDIQIIKEDLKKHTDISLMSGSGSTVFTISKEKEKIDELYEIFKNKYYFVCKTKIKN